MGGLHNKEMKDALRELRDEEIRTLPGGESVLSETGRNKARGRGRWQKAAVIAAVLAALCAGFFAVNPKAYAAVVSWIRGEVVEKTGPRGDQKSMMYYELPGTSDKTAEYRFGWAPARFDQREEMASVHDKEITGFDYSVEYRYEVPGPAWDAVPESGRFDIGYAYLEGNDPKMYFMFDNQNYTRLENGSIEEGSFTGEYYVYVYNKKGTGFFDSFWVDSETGVCFRLTGDITKEEAFRIIDNVRRTK